MTVTLITGANKGIGYEAARQLTAQGHTVYIGARSIERASKAAVSMLTLQYAKAMPEIKFNAIEPGQTATGLTGGNGRPVEESGKVVVRIATIGADGPTGTFQEDTAELAW